MSSQLALAAQLSQCDRADLETLLRARWVSNPTAIRDSLDLSAALLKPESIRRALSALPRDALASLLADSSIDSQPVVMNVLALPSDTQPVAFTAMPEVRDVLTSLLAQAGITADDLAAPLEAFEQAPPAHPVAEHAREHLAAEHAFETVRAVNQLLRTIADEPALMRTASTPTVATTKRLAAALGLESAQTQSFIRLLLDSDLVHADNDRCVVTAMTADWASWSRPERFSVLAEAWCSQREPYVRAVLEHAQCVDTATAQRVMRWMFPLASEDFALRLDDALTDGTVFGLIVAGRLSTVGQQYFAGERGAARAYLEQAFPTSVAHVYVQPDLSIVAPGPLDSAIEEQLLNFAILESSGLASSYRISARTLESALSAGHSETDIRDFLTAHSLTGIPQPLDYLLSEATRRHGSIVIRDALDDRLDARIRALVCCTDPAVAAQLRVDRSLTSLALAPLGDTELSSLFEPTQVATALRAAGYAVSVEAQPVSRTERATDDARDDPITQLADRVFDAAQHEAEGGSVERLLELAVRQKQRIRAVMQQSDGTLREFVLRPVGLSNGRLRGIDEQAEVERTLPVSLLTEVEHLADESR